MAVEAFTPSAFENLGNFLGLFHPLFIHFPIVFLVVLFVWDAYFFFAQKTGFFFIFRSAVLYLGSLFVLASLATGLLAAGAYPENDTLVERHERLAILLMAAVLIHAVLWFFSSLSTRIRFNAVFITLSLTTLILVSITAEYGAIIVHDTTLFQLKPELKNDNEVINTRSDRLDSSAESLRSFLRENIDHKDAREVFERNKCASCHAKKFSSDDFMGFTKGRHPWLSLDENGDLKDLENSPFYKKVILKNTMPPKGEVRDVAGLNAADRLILIEWLFNNLKFHPSENAGIEE